MSWAKNKKMGGLFSRNLDQKNLDNCCAMYWVPVGVFFRDSETYLNYYSISERDLFSGETGAYQGPRDLEEYRARRARQASKALMGNRVHLD